MNAAALLGGLGGAAGGGPTKEEDHCKICREEIEKKVADGINTDLAGMSESGIMKECAIKIITTICETIQDKYRKEITTDLIDILKEASEKLTNDKESLKQLFFKSTEPVDPKKKEKKEKEGQVCIMKPIEDLPTKPPKISEISEVNRDEILRFTTNVICNYIKNNAGLLKNLVDGLKIRFDKYILDNNAEGLITWSLLGPVAESIKLLIKSEYSAGNLSASLKMEKLEDFGISAGDATAIKNVQDAITKGVARDNIILGKLKTATATSTRELAAGGEFFKRGGSKTKTKIYKKLLNRERTLKRRIFSN